MDSISLTISRDNTFLEEGRQWGVVQIRLRIEAYDYPVQVSNASINAILNVPENVLDVQDVDPDYIDISITQNNIADMREMALRGEITDDTEALAEVTEPVKYKKSVMKGPRGEKPKQQVNEWSFMNDARLRGVPEDQQSKDNWDDTNSSVSVEMLDEFNRDGKPLSPKLKPNKVKFSNVTAKPATFKKTNTYIPKTTYAPKIPSKRYARDNNSYATDFIVSDPTGDNSRF